MLLDYAISLLSRFAKSVEVEHEPYLIAGRELRPVTRTMALGGNGAWALRLVQPVALVERYGDAVRRYAIPTGLPSPVILTAAVIAPVLVWLLISLLMRRAVL